MAEESPGLFGGENAVFAGGEFGGEFGGLAVKVVDEVGHCGGVAGKCHGGIGGSEVGHHHNGTVVDRAREHIEIGAFGLVTLDGATLHAGAQGGFAMLQGVEFLIECEVFVTRFPLGGFVFDEELEGAVEACLLACIDKRHAGQCVAQHGKGARQVAETLKLCALPRVEVVV